MTYEYRTKRRVAFADTDMAGILHFSNYFRYMEEAEHAFFRSLGMRVHMDTADKAWGFARKKVECTYSRPLRYEDVTEIQVLVREKRTRSITYEVVFRLAETEDDPDAPWVEVARGTMVTVCVTRPEGSDQLVATPIPPEVDAALEVAPPELFAAP